MVKKILKPKKNVGMKRKVALVRTNKSQINVEKAIVENFVSFQKVMANLSLRFDNLSSQISKLLDLFEISAETEVESQAHAAQPKLVTEVRPRDLKPQATSEIKSPLPHLRPSGPAQPVGPVEELKLMTLEDFRRLGEPQEAAQKIYQKIDLLADESLELKAEAIKAWKASPAYQNYLTIGHKSMESNKSVEEVIRHKTINDMSKFEFEAIGDLNRSLQF